MDYHGFESLFPEVDEKATVKQVKSFFEHTIPKMERYAHQNIIDIKSPVISDMPKGGQHGNSSEETIVKHLYAQQVLERTVQALGHCTDMSQKIIKRLYFSYNKPYDYQLMNDLGYGENRYYFYKNKAFFRVCGCILFGRFTYLQA
ncbi:ArpU family phage packaging/lysis transcriptional regulator [Lentilactobacillus rapi]|uniref:ArpU family phage packaging/lysis transcriptional regulator n=1 Tax=Lentilactobacillus rapi TaxID=481723 RepID=UPI0006CFF84F|nr:ArpU family phage packaging/lysis transcriptional regulator [Lentilactobacillus rapi]